MSAHRTYKLEYLENLPTISVGQTDDLKIETKDTRVWLSRMTIEDGMEYNNQVTIEKLKGGYVSATREQYEKQGKRGTHKNPYWQKVYTYEAK